MEYLIIKKIKYDKKKKKFITTWADSNVFCPSGKNCLIENDDSDEYLNTLAREKGIEEAEMQILLYYLDGAYQGGNNKYTRALKILQHTPKAQQCLTFEQRGKGKEDQRLQDPEARHWLKWALHAELPKPRFVIAKPYIESTVYGKFTGKTMYWKPNIEDATKFRWREDAEKVIKLFDRKMVKRDKWKILNLERRAKK